MARRRIELSEAALAEDLAAGRCSQAEIARRHGISRRHLGEIAAGRSRPAVAERVAKLRRGDRQRFHRRLVELQDKALRTLTSAVEGRKVSSVALSAAKEILNRAPALDNRGQAPDSPDRPDTPSRRALMELSPKLRQAVIRELGGPEE